MEVLRKVRAKETMHSHQLLAMFPPVRSTRTIDTRNQNREDVLVSLHRQGHGTMFQCRPLTMDAEETSINVLPQPIVNSGSHSGNATNRYEDPDGIQESHLELLIVVHKACKTDLLVEDATSVESLVVILISIRLMGLHYVEVRHHHLLPPELHWTTRYLVIFEIPL